MSEQNSLPNDSGKALGLLPANSLQTAAGTLNEARMLSILAMPMDDGLPAIVWDSTSLCDPKCPVYEKCKAKGLIDKTQGRCPIQAKYVRSVTDILFSAIRARGDDVTLIEVGFLLIPLYSQLAKLKIYESSLNGVYVYTDNKGNPTIHPLLREIRATITNIQMMTKEILNKNDLRGAIANLKQMANASGGNELEGSANYYAKMRSRKVERAYKVTDDNIDDILDLSTPPSGISNKGDKAGTPHKNYPKSVQRSIGKAMRQMTPEEREKMRQAKSYENRDKRANSELREECATILEEEAQQPPIIPEHLPPSTHIRRKPKGTLV
jgi:hypothetical protein